MTSNTQCYVLQKLESDSEAVWYPVIVLETTEDEFKVKLQCQSSSSSSLMVSIARKDYDNGQLPLQNVSNERLRIRRLSRNLNLERLGPQLQRDRGRRERKRGGEWNGEECGHKLTTFHSSLASRPYCRSIQQRVPP